MNNQQFWWSKQTAVMVSIACIAFWITRLCNLTLGLSMHPDYVSLIGSWLVGILGNGYSRRFGGTAFTAMLTGILLLVPVRIFSIKFNNKTLTHDSRRMASPQLEGLPIRIKRKARTSTPRA